MNVAVLCGGISTEREISIKSGANVCKALRSIGHNAVLVDAYFGIDDPDIFEHSENDYDIEMEKYRLDSMTSSIKSYTLQGRPFFGKNVLYVCEQSDIVFMALHGKYGEDGLVQATLDLFCIKYTGSGYTASAIGMDKGVTKQIFLSKNVPTPKSIWIKENEDADFLKTGMEFPVVVKVCNGGSSVGVIIAKDEKEYNDAIYECFKLDSEILVEEFIEGREFSVGVFGSEALPVVEIIPKTGWYDYENKYEPGAVEEVCPAKISEELTKKMQQVAVDACNAVGCSPYARADIMMDASGNIYCLEVNTLPGMTETSLVPREAAAIGIDFPHLCEKIIEMSLEKYE